jgi:hypothetical protein
MLDTAVLFIVFNRPDTTQKVFDVIKSVKPKRLYITADGPRKNNENDRIKSEECRSIVHQIDWECELKTLFRDENLGCRNAVSDAISWFFKHEEQGIVLEDDCLPDPSFFDYCQELLEKYKNTPEIMLISGNNFQNGIKRGDASYYFSRYNHIWGWASWRRAWQLYDVDMKTFSQKKEENFIQKIFYKKKIQNYWMKRFQKSHDGEINTWDYQWTYTIFSHHGISILPNVNLISNIGFGEQSTHTAKANKRLANLPIQKINFPLTHPSEIKINEEADLYTFSRIFSPPLFVKIMSYINNKW